MSPFKFLSKRYLSRHLQSRPPPISPIFYYPYERQRHLTSHVETDTTVNLPMEVNSVPMELISEKSCDGVNLDTVDIAFDSNINKEPISESEYIPLVAEFDYHKDNAMLKSKIDVLLNELRVQGFTPDFADLVFSEENEETRTEIDSLLRVCAGRDIDIASVTGENESFSSSQNCPLRNRALPNENTAFENAASKLVFSTVSTVVRAYNVLSRISCGWIAIPTTWVNNFAFFPPSPFRHYYLSYIDSTTNERVIGNAQVAYGQPSIRFEPVIENPIKQHLRNVRRFTKRSETFIVASESGNFIVMVKIHAERPPGTPKSHKVILMANSNASDLGVSFDACLGVFLSDNHPDNYDFYMFDYSGYGLSSGKPSEKAIYADVRAVYNYILKDQNDPLLKVVLFGISIGTTVVADLAASCPSNLGGVVLVAPLTSGIRHVAGANPPKKTASSDVFKILDISPRIQVPVLCVHGLADTMMPPTNSAQIYAAVQRPVDPLYVPHASHLGVLLAPELVVRLRIFIEKEIDIDHAQNRILC